MKATVASVFLVLGLQGFAALPGVEMLSRLIIEQFDLDHDSTLDANEWQNGTNDGFAEIDHDRDGFISEGEIDALSEPLGEEIGRVGASVCVVLIKKLLMTLDKDRDHRVSKAEYEEGCAAIFKKLDANRDGTITLAELNDLPAKLLHGSD